MQATRTAVVDVPVGTVWKIAADHEGMTDWGPGVHATLLKRGTGDRNGVGAVRKIKTTLPAPAIVEEITAFEPEQRLAYRAVSGVPLKNYSGEIALRTVPAGTEITYTIRADQRVPLVDGAMVGLICRALLSLLTRQAKRTR